jgi:NitT/TauT family transport system substrate-binding protein
MGTSSQVLTTNNPNVHSIKDFTDRDRIALPAARVSIQAVLLEMAAAKAFGDSEYTRLDRLTVSMKHPDAMAALLSGGSEVTAHFAVDPYAARELRDPRVHTVLNSCDLLGGPHTGVVLCATTAFYRRNPRVSAVVLSAVREACRRIRSDRKGVVDLYLKVAKTGETPDEILAQLNNPQFTYDVAPRRVTLFSDFMARTGAVKHRPATWKDLFFADLHGEKGS